MLFSSIVFCLLCKKKVKKVVTPEISVILNHKNLLWQNIKDCQSVMWVSCKVFMLGTYINCLRLFCFHWLLHRMGTDRSRQSEHQHPPLCYLLHQGIVTLLRLEAVPPQEIHQLSSLHTPKWRMVWILFWQQLTRQSTGQMRNQFVDHLSDFKVFQPSLLPLALMIHWKLAVQLDCPGVKLVQHPHLDSDL